MGYIVVRGVLVQLQVCLRLVCICPMDVLRVVVPGKVVPRVVVPDVVVPGVVSALFGMTPLWQIIHYHYSPSLSQSQVLSSQFTTSQIVQRLLSTPF